MTPEEKYERVINPRPEDVLWNLQDSLPVDEAVAAFTASTRQYVLALTFSMLADKAGIPHVNQSPAA